MPRKKIRMRQLTNWLKPDISFYSNSYDKLVTNLQWLELERERMNSDKRRYAQIRPYEGRNKGTLGAFALFANF